MRAIKFYPVWRRGFGYGFVAATVKQYGNHLAGFRASCTMCGDVGGFTTRETATTRAKQHEAEHA